MSIFPTGTAIRHKDHHDLTGTVEHSIQPEPEVLFYIIDWDNENLAEKALGIVYRLVNSNVIECRPAQQDIEALFGA